jgi:DNA polymerase III subunit beta
MKIRIARDELLMGLQRVQGVVEKRNTMPALSNILLETKQDGVELVATDLEIGIRGHYKAEVLEPGSVSVSARKLFEILREMPDSEIAITTQDNNWVQIHAGKIQFKIVGLPGTDFPALPTVEREGRVSISGSGLASLIRRTMFAVGDNDARYILNGLLITLVSNDKKVMMRLVGTDGHRLAVAESELAQDAVSEMPKEIRAIIPRKAAQEMRRLLEEEAGEPLLGFTKNLVTFQRSGVFLTSRVMEGTYPNYQQVIPKDNTKKVTVDRAALEGALRRVAVLSRDKTNAVRITLDAEILTLYSSNPDLGEATEELPVQYRGESLTTGFNARYFLDALAAMDSEIVHLEMKSALSPCVLKPEGDPGFLCVVMPMKV